MIEIYKNTVITHTVPNDDLCNLNAIRLVPLREFLEELGLDLDDFSKTNRVLETKRTLCNVHTMETALNNIKVVKHEWQRKYIFFLGTTMHFPQKTHKDYLPEDIYPYLLYDDRKYPWFRPTFHYKLYDHRDLSRYLSKWHVATY